MDLYICTSYGEHVFTNCFRNYQCQGRLGGKIESSKDKSEIQCTCILDSMCRLEFNMVLGKHNYWQICMANDIKLRDDLYRGCTLS